MNFIKKNPLLAGACGLFVLLLAGSTWLLIWQIDQRTKTGEEMDSQSKTRASFLDKGQQKIAISEKNVEIIQDEALEISKRMDEMLEPFYQFQVKEITFEPLEPNECQARINSQCQEIIKKLEDAGVQYTPSANDELFGFKDYKSKPPEKKRDTPMLLKQLRIIDELANIAVNSHLAKITSIQRVKIEGDSKEKDNKKQSPPGQPPVKKETPNDPLISLFNDFAYVEREGYIYTLMPFNVAFTCRSEKEFRQFLNELSHSSLMFLPRIIRVDAQKSEPLKQGAHASGGGASKAVVQEFNNPLDIPFALGGSDELFDVRMRIDFIEFHKTADGSNQDKHKKKPKKDKEPAKDSAPNP